MKIFGNIIDIHKRKIFSAEIKIFNNKIIEIRESNYKTNVFIIPGLIDSHIHIESSMITPGAFAEIAVKHGTTGVVSDPHEIANVLGIDGVKFMIEDGKKVNFKFYFGAPSCVPATSNETNGATIGYEDVEELLKRNEIKFLAEMMNFPGVIYNDIEVVKKINCAKNLNKVIDGHAPGLSGEMLRRYVKAGISTDHECSTIKEAEEKISLGMKIIIREGSAARNLDSLKDLYRSYPEMIMLCSDDLHPELLLKRHINKLVSKLIKEGYDIFDVLRSATYNPVMHYGLDAGLLREGDFADFVIVDNPENMNVLETWINGIKVFENGRSLFSYAPEKSLNNFNCSFITEDNISIKNEKGEINVIVAKDGELLTNKESVYAGDDRIVSSNIDEDILKIVVKDRYNDSFPAVGFIKGFGIKRGAFASSVAHDSHNIISVGTNDHDIVKAINEIVRNKGGLSVANDGIIDSLKLNIAGIMADRSCSEVADDYERLSNKVKSFGSEMKAPFMTLSFMALLVIPSLKIGDKGLFDVDKFRFTSLFSE
jgi:adenine deaminase